MALYAFDGTGNRRYTEPETEAENTNVVRFLEAYYLEEDDLCFLTLEDNEEYLEGVGTRAGIFGKIFGGFNGAGGRDRVEEFVSRFKENWSGGDHVIDVIGFSRGAALALHFCNALSKGIEIEGEEVHPEIRFLGLWDTVHSFGLPGVFIDAFQKINIGWNFNVPPNVKCGFHAMALDETRQAFQVHRPRVMDPESTRFEEMWFKGVHADVGGGNGRFDLSSIALHWMLECASECGCKINGEVMRRFEAEGNPHTPPAKNPFAGDTEHRKVQPGDRFHPSAASPLAVGDSRTIRVDPSLKFNLTDLLIEPGGAYTIEVEPGQTWVDKNIVCTAAGWPEKLPDNKPGILDDVGWFALNSYLFSNAKRVRQANWFELVACLDYDLRTAVGAGQGQYETAETAWEVEKPGRLSLFANDAESKYSNNSGHLNVTVRRVG